jgi:hypothetical protein
MQGTNQGDVKTPSDTHSVQAGVFFTAAAYTPKTESIIR